MQHLSGADFDVMIGTMLINVKQYTLNVEDGTKATSTRGVPDGHVRGKAAASGEIVVDTANFNLILESARAAGSFQELDPFDIVCTASNSDQSMKTVAYGCKLTISKLVDASGDGEDKMEHSLPYQVTDSRFVEINDIPYLNRKHVEKLGF